MNTLFSDIDVIIGEKIKTIRKMSDLSQSVLAERIGVTFQQIQKYEKGKSVISVRRLLQIAAALDVPITVFLGNAGDEDNKGQPSFVASPEVGYGETSMPLPEFILTEDEKNLVRHFRKVNHPKIRESLIRQVKGVSDHD